MLNLACVASRGALIKGALNHMREWPIRAGRIPVIFSGVVESGRFRSRYRSIVDPWKRVELGSMFVSSPVDLVDKLSEIAQLTGEVVPRYQCARGVIACDGDVQGDEGRVEEWGAFRLSGFPSSIFGRDSAVMPAVEASCRGMVSAPGSLSQYFTQLFEQTCDRGVPLAAKALVIEARSGVGVSIVSGEKVIATDLGCLRMPGVGPARADHLEDGRMLAKLGDPSFGQLLSRKGLCRIFRYLGGYDRGCDEIKEAAFAGSEPERTALLLRSRFLFRASKVLATAAACDQVLLILDDALRTHDFFMEHEEVLGGEYFDFIRPSWVKGIPVFVQRREADWKLLGCESVALNRESSL